MIGWQCKMHVENIKKASSLQKVGIIDCSCFENKMMVKEIIYKLKTKFNEDVIVVTGGNHGAEANAKKFALEMNLKYKEFNPAGTAKNLYSAMPSSYYSKPFHATQFYHRYDMMIRYCDTFFIFVDKSVVAQSVLRKILSYISEHEKPYALVYA